MTMSGPKTAPFAEPFERFTLWYDEATKKEPVYPDAVCLATADAKARPSARIVLLKEMDARGFVFYTNYESRKGGQMAENPHAALCFHWKSLEKSVRIEGRIEKVSSEESDDYFASRVRGSQIGAWASRQSRPLAGRFELEKRVAEFAAKFGIGKVPRPDHWGGYRLLPSRIEFWEEGSFRLHKRDVYIISAQEANWEVVTLFP